MSDEGNLPKHDNRFRDTSWEDCAVTVTQLDNIWADAQRYQWLKEHVFEVLCEGKGDCYSKYMLPRLVAEDSTGKKFTFDEIIDIQMKRSGDEG